MQDPKTPAVHDARNAKHFRSPSSGGEFSSLSKKLLTLGKERGFITYDELNAALPSEQVTSEQLDGVMNMLAEAGVNVVEKGDMIEVEAEVVEFELDRSLELNDP